ncbi:uncharacterized protein LOC130734672 [Lotus japonicus]|uniref:uncharacterized protein LOC130734672 n=1 Tax=Lotus japonicus TaxID=34305 RepID=UPI00258A96F3|nr:uncharacterized protein LOC130734672 [Lotus japonicus]
MSNYHSHISRVSREPGFTDVPRQYPNGHLVNERIVYEEDVYNEGSPRYAHHHHHHNPETRERVEVIEYERVPAGRVGVGEVIYEENVVDYETDQYYPGRNRGTTAFAVQRGMDNRHFRR